MLLGLNVWLPSLDPARLSGDLSFHAQILRRIQGACMDLSADTRWTMSKNLGLIMYGLLEPIDDSVSYVQIYRVQILLTHFFSRIHLLRPL
jgi:hypothetical protein